MRNGSTYKVIIAGGGTGGHIFPAVAIAEELKNQFGASVEILFVGAKGRMEMEKIPALGYNIIGLEVVGFQRDAMAKNLLFPFKLIKSLNQARKVIKDFKPDIAIGVGGYASGPVLFLAGLFGIPTLIQEQNSYPGVTNKILSKTAKKICVAYDGMESYFPKEKIILTGNPVRKDIASGLPEKSKALSFFGLQENKKTILVIGGSLGARTINQSIEPGLEMIAKENYQLIWQTGKIYFQAIMERIEGKIPDGIVIREFLKEMDMAYSAVDIIISRAGALSISELCLVGKPAIFVPSPNVAEDHQTKNAMALVNKNAALMVKDLDAKEQLVTATLGLLKDEDTMVLLGDNILALSKPAASQTIVNEIKKILAA